MTCQQHDQRDVVTPASVGQPGAPGDLPRTWRCRRLATTLLVVVASLLTAACKDNPAGTGAATSGSANPSAAPSGSARTAASGSAAPSASAVALAPEAAARPFLWVVPSDKGNSYLSIYKCGTIDGLHIEGNDISVPGKIADIYVVANRNSGSQPCRNVRILNNVTRSHGIQIAGDPGENNLVKGNQHIGGGGKLTNEARAKVEGNRGYGS